MPRTATSERLDKTGTPVPRWVWISIALSGLVGLWRLLTRPTEPWVLWLGIGFAVVITLVLVIMKVGFPHLVADEQRNGRVFLALAAIWVLAVVAYALINFEEP